MKEKSKLNKIRKLTKIDSLNKLKKINKINKVLIIIFSIVVLLSLLIYLDYFIAKTNGSSPKISIKKRLDENSYVYKAVLYKVWYCETNKTYTFGDYKDKDAICPKNYSYVDGYYTNDAGVKISKRDLQLLTNDGIYTSDMVENMTSNKQVEESVSVAYNYGKNKYKKLNEKSTDGKELVIFPEFKEENNNYKWVYDEEKKYCLKEDSKGIQISEYLEEACNNYVPLKMDETWCKNYENSTLVYEDGIDKLCAEK